MALAAAVAAAGRGVAAAVAAAVAAVLAGLRVGVLLLKLPFFFNFYQMIDHRRSLGGHQRFNLGTGYYLTSGVLSGLLEVVR